MDGKCSLRDGSLWMCHRGRGDSESLRQVIRYDNDETVIQLDVGSQRPASSRDAVLDDPILLAAVLLLNILWKAVV